MSERIEALMERVKDAPGVEVTRDRYGYRIDGEFYRRVTTFCQGLPKPWLASWAAKEVAEFAVDNREQWSTFSRTNAVKLLKGAPWSKRDDAGDRGTAVHNTLEAVARGHDIPDGLTDDERACAEAAARLLRERGSRILASELTVYNPTYGYAGTLDLWEIDKDGLFWVLDYKTSSGIYVEHAVQLAAYRNAEFAVVNKKAVNGSAEKWAGKVIPWGPDMVDRLGVVHVQPGHATLYPVRYTDRLWTVFRAAAHVKLFQLDTDDYAGKTPREQVFGEPTMNVTNEEAMV